MTMEEKRLKRLYELLEKLGDKQKEEKAALRWAIFTLEELYRGGAR